MRLLQDRGGATSIVFAIALMPLILAVGLAIDVGFHMKAAADAEAGSRSSAMATAAGTSAYLILQSMLPEFYGADAGTTNFTSQTMEGPSSNRATMTTNVASPGPEGRDQTITSSFVTETNTSTFFGTIVGVDSLTSRNASAGGVSYRNSYVDINFVVDTGPSMGIVADDASSSDFPAFVQANYPGTWNAAAGMRSTQCAMACRYATAGPDPDLYSIARANGYVLRLDQVKHGLQDAMNVMINSPRTSRFRVGIWTAASGGATNVFPGAQADQNTGWTDGDLNAARNAAAAIEPEPVSQPDASPRARSSHVGASLLAVSASTGYRGTGTGQQNPRQVMVLVTDGIDDFADPASGSRTLAPMDGTACDAAKATGLRLVVLYTRYRPLWSSYGSTPAEQYQNGSSGTPPASSPDPAAVKATLQGCASSPGDFYQADRSDDVFPMMRMIAQTAIMGTVHLTQ